MIIYDYSLIAGKMNFKPISKYLPTVFPDIITAFPRYSI